ncbi:hypothetical protein QR685DRAFT_606423 [Neurospora intermedia]|uniref:Uncharacterized protein n=1 Tax=Neurospora intermedia TaxID=5142 RepID=A0ABR3DF20_NEUIN
MGGTQTLRKVFGLKPKSSCANLQPQPITPDNFNTPSDDLSANGIHSNNGRYQSYNPNGSSTFASNNYGQPPGLSSISELPANEYGNGYTHQVQQSHLGHGHHQRKSLPAQARPSPNPQYPHDPNAYYQHHGQSSGNLSPQDAVHSQNGSSNRDRRSASLGSRLSLSNFGSTSSNSSLGRSSVTTMSTISSSAATSPGPGPSPVSPHHLSQSQHPHCLSPGYQPGGSQIHLQSNSPRYPGQPVHQEPQAQQQQQQHDERKHRNPLSSSRHRTASQQYLSQTSQTQHHNVLHKHHVTPAVHPPYPVSERGSPPPPHSRSSHSTSNPLHNLHSFANRTSSHPHPAQPHPGHQSPPHSHSQQQPQFPTATDIRRTTKLLRRMFELRLEQWALTHSHESDQHLLYEKQRQVDAVLADILGNVQGWGIERGRNKTWTDDEWEDICLVRDVLAEMSAPSGGGPGGGPMGMGMGMMGYGIGGGGGGGVPVEVGGGGRGERGRRW